MRGTTKVLALLATLAGFATFQFAQSERKKVDLFVATIIAEHRGSFQVTSFVDAETDRRNVEGHVAQYLEEKFPGSKVISVRIEPVADELLDRVCRDRAARRRF